ncbi:MULTISPECIES: VOC family protein [unclassified Novosphingobium]|uniref:VOC family protein n=1 Tax=unclassified Novosphingobium TaxID=2644732 RepID=UPI00135A87AC|nr:MULTISPECIES: VOC family protein [unclassified Novosphingobium]
MTHIGARYGQLAQMSYVTRDMDAAVAHAETQLGITGLVRSQADIEVMSHGQRRRLAVKSAIANMGPPGAVRQFEIIQPVAGATEIYTDAVDLGAHILGFHHIGIAVPGAYSEWENLLAQVRASGDEFAYLFPAEPSPEAKLCFCYVDTRRQLGHYTEYLWADPALAGIPVAPWL